MTEKTNYITPAGYRRLREEYEALFGNERPKLVETISWAAGNGDRSENGDYIYGPEAASRGGSADQLAIEAAVGGERTRSGAPARPKPGLLRSNGYPRR
jgi:hypothetical protein